MYIAAYPVISAASTDPPPLPLPDCSAKGMELLFYKFPPFFILQHKQIHTLLFTH